MQGTVAKIANKYFLQKKEKEFPDMSAKKKISYKFNFTLNQKY